MGIRSFEKIRIRLASPEKIEEWSHGEVTKPETINYRTLNPESDGLFCEKIFGPTKDWECACGKYKRMRYKGLVCEKCGVEVTRSKVRRERMGHISLAAPVSHIWYSKGTPNKMSLIIGLSPKELESVLYFARYVVTETGESNLKEGKILTEKEYKLYKQLYGNRFEALMGAEAILKLLEKINLEELRVELEKELDDVSSSQKRKKVVKRLKIVRDFIASNNKPEWMILKNVPVIPADLRPMVQLDGGRFATSDLNDLYRRVINRNNRLKKLLEIKAPEIVVKNEKRMLQEAVDALIDNGRRGKPVVAQNNRELKSLSDMLKGKQGRFRQNLLGKRVDYSARSVIVVGPSLKMNQCGIPKKMALELYKPFIMRELVKRELASNIKTAKKLVEEADDKVWDVIEDVIQDHPVLLNRAPTLHRLSIQAFEPVLIEGKAIRLHPLVCSAFNADFDGDQMAVHLMLSPEAIMEAKLLMLAPNNIISPSNGEPIAVPSQDMVMGCFYMTKERPGSKGEGKAFSNIAQALTAYHNGVLDTHAMIKVRINGEMIETTPGRLMFNELLPEVDKQYNQTFGKSQLKKLIAKLYDEHGFTETAELINKIKDFGYHYGAMAGVSVGIEDLEIPAAKKDILAKADEQVAQIEADYKAGKIINEERYRKTITVWSEATDAVTKAMMNGLDQFNPVYMMANSGARGNISQMRQLAAMRGNMADTQGRIIEVPIKANFREGLTVLEFFMSSHGARKGLADTALRTADSGYLTRRLVDISHEVIVNAEDCGTHQGIEVGELISEGKVIEELKERINGRVLAEDLVYEGEVIAPRNTLIGKELIKKIDELGIRKVKIRSPLTCALEKGVCRKCYGMDLSNHKEILLGEAVGVIAAQSIGEPGTQLTMRTFHTGGVATAAAVVSGVRAENSGKVAYRDVKILVNEENGDEIVVSQSAKLIIGNYDYEIPSGSILKVKEGQQVEIGETLVTFDPFHIPIIADQDGRIEYRELYVKENYDEKYDVTEFMAIKPVESGDINPRVVVFDAEGNTKGSYTIPFGAYLMVREGEEIKKGQIIAKIIKEGAGTKDITGGLPRVQELFEARNPKGKAMLTEIEGKVEVTGKKKKGMRVILVKSVSDSSDYKEYLVPVGERLVVTDGMLVKAGDKITEGAISPFDVLNIKGLVAAEQFILESVQQVYRDQGVTVNDKHIEIIVKQMFKKVRIVDSGASLFLEDEVVEKRVVELENEKLQAEGKAIIKYEPIIQGITKAAVNTGSFISAASFQETTKVLSNAAIEGKVDFLEGLKENVIIGKKIPAGTGFSAYKKIKAKVIEEDLMEQE
ncbi:MAG: DNA-directed RNA polymerase subunit beta' [Fusobacterium mortiferum]|jgi:DNA-directed RNA polymerase subunit beta'|uniref:DNA-directed RNA polymerase subunit beta' n=2 Tax=Fusobacterium mortiferum TaxID=850 RepID=A0A414PRI3_FUSMR|nr:DNA-directed RNA polymerase subunit beta' [Fusobacterium mortiferum]AVQ17922.1 DNA-directed RNA polymerase subunit beta' [Fusobacterium mortiferum ATCC 9817]EEO36893.2 DNA-directed RNA polymerase, beta' subunit [Fusobacterium mortiferum ATCC 9817]MCF2628217.1 DNA-directed RNA polymerase subunit beta' [Fusobacterium mortiferum]MCF2700029.1 DNA-directed RNA polymerase subunit beta' [Fusobacterium mortiferum]MCI7666326.1 DNA-directed RNA polymerase subunit beta' [Fusobacterium mortiferum]